MKRYQKIFAVLFLLLLLPFSILNFFWERGAIRGGIAELEKPKKAAELKEYMQSVDGLITKNIAGGHRWNELYGSIYRALGKNEENSFKYVRDKKGFLYSGNFYNNSDVSAAELAGRVRRLQDKLKEKDTKFMVVMYPTKYNKDWSDGYYGIPYNDLNRFGDDVLRYFRRYDVDYMDFREILKDAGMGMDDIFYRTDHHWTVPTAFFATGKLIEHLNQHFNAGLDPDGFYRDIRNYRTETYENIYMGSQGRDTGEIYAGPLDDYTFIYPKFDTKFKYYYRYRGGKEGQKEGDMAHTLIERKYLDYKDPYEREMNNGYLQGIVRFDRIENELNPGGPSIAFIRDSYSSPVAAFLSPMCSRIELAWSIHFNPTGQGTIEKMVLGEKHFDYVILALAMDNFSNEGLPFCIEEKKTDAAGAAPPKNAAENAQ